MSNNIPEITLNDGLTLPVVGLGTYLLKGNAGVQSILSAIDMGYRLIDSAYNYENEGTVGEAVRRSSVPREHLKISSNYLAVIKRMTKPLQRFKNPYIVPILITMIFI